MSVLKDADVGAKIYDAVKNALNLAPDKKTQEFADNYAHFAVEVYNYIKARPELQNALQGTKTIYDAVTGGAGYATAMGYATRATEMNMAASAGRFTSFGSYNAGGVVAAFVDSFAGLATALHIEMNECALAITKVVIGTIAGLALVESGVGVVLGALQLLSIASDSKDVYKACFAPDQGAGAK